MVCLHDRVVTYVEFHLEGGPITSPWRSATGCASCTELLLWMMLLLPAGDAACARVRACPCTCDVYDNTLSVTFRLVFTRSV